MTTNSKSQPPRLGGWLILFCSILITVTVIAAPFEFIAVAYFDSWLLRLVGDPDWVLGIAQIVLLPLLSGLSVYAIVTSILVLAKANGCIRNAKRYLIVSSAICIPLILSLDYPPYPFYIYLAAILAFIGHSAGWYLYLLKSRRVRLLIASLAEREELRATHYCQVHK